MKRTLYVVYEPVSKRFYINKPSDRLCYRVTDDVYEDREIFTDDIEKCKLYLTKRLAQNAAKIVNNDYNQAIHNLKYYIDRDIAMLDDPKSNGWMRPDDITETTERIKKFHYRIGHIMRIRTQVEVRELHATLTLGSTP